MSILENIPFTAPYKYKRDPEFRDSERMAYLKDKKYFDNYHGDYVNKIKADINQLEKNKKLALEWDKKIYKVEIENDLSGFDDDELYELANYYKYPAGDRQIDVERSNEYSNRIWNEIEKRKNPFTKDLPQGDTMGSGDFR